MSFVSILCRLVRCVIVGERERENKDEKRYLVVGRKEEGKILVPPFFFQKKKRKKERKRERESLGSDLFGKSSIGAFQHHHLLRLFLAEALAAIAVALGNHTVVPLQGERKQEASEAM